MYPELFHFNNITISSYAVCIVLGTFIAAIYVKNTSKRKLNVIISNHFIYLIFISGYIGGKVFFYLEKPFYYIKNPEAILNTFSSGFVFYGSFIFIMFTAIWYFKQNRISVLPMLDILAISTAMIQIVGRLGCFFAGCCYGVPTDNKLGVVFPTSNGFSVHPTQLYESFLSALILFFLLRYKKQFNGQLFLFYLGFYAIGRIILELFRGDIRGQIINGYLSHSQGIAIVLLLLSVFLYKKLNKQLT